MSAEAYAFQVGNIVCTVVSDGESVIGKDGILRRFPNLSEAECREAFTAIGLSLDEAESSLNILIAKVGAETVLVDTGQAGRPNGGHLLAGMQQAGIAPDTVTMVVLTHTHGDHVLGLLTADNQPAFPKARYVLSKAEMEAWRKRVENNAPDQRAIIDMLEANDLRLIDGDEQIIPGLTAVSIPGHTPGQLALLFESEHERLIHLADMLHSPMQFAHPEWSPSFDADPILAATTRRNMLQRAAEENLLAIFYHLPFPGLGHVSRAETGFVWTPV
jgi:glyoxylase-like metal-dependent hydrolase (beta-lactamase superfamily II)